MKQNKVFLVNDSEHVSRVITASTFEKDITLNVQDLKIKQKYIESYVEDAMNDLSGKAMTEGDYSYELSNARTALSLFVTLSPYTFFRDYASQIKE